MLDSRWAAVRKLLLVRLDNIGDVVLLSAAVRTARENLPEARLTLMASPAGAQAAPLLPWLDDLVVWRAVWQDVGGGMPLDPAREMGLVEDLRRRGFDAAIVFTSFSQSPHGAAYACYLAGIPLRLGESKEFGGGLLTTEVRNMPDGFYQAERSLRLMEAVGFLVRDRRPRVEVPDSARERARALLLNRGIDPEEGYLVVHPGASCQARRYPRDGYAEVARLLSRRLGLRVLLTGSAGEGPDLGAIASGSGGGVTSVAGETRVEELAAVLEGAVLVVCNDSLPMHLAAALGVPSVVTFSGTDLESQWASPHTPARLLRRETACSPCYLMRCPYGMECLAIPPEEVVEAAVEVLRGTGAGGAAGGDAGRQRHEPVPDGVAGGGRDRRRQAATLQEPGSTMELGRVERIAVFRALHLGDFLCSVPALRALRERYPRAEITLIGLPWVRAILDRYPYVDRLAEFPGYQGLEGVGWDPRRTEGFLRDARQRGYDLAIQMHGDGRVSNGFVAGLGARATLGYRPEDSVQPRRLDLELPLEEGEHEVLRCLRLVAVVGARGSPELEFPLTPGDRAEARRVARRAGIDLENPVVGIHPGGKDPAKRWPAEQFALVADLMAAELGAQVVLTGSRDELAVARRVAEGMRRPAFVVAGGTSLGGLAALLAQMRLLVTNDTGPSHLAAALGVPSVVLFGPTEPSRWAPLDRQTHRALWSGRGNPISQIPVERVVEESLALVQRWAYQTY